LLRPHVIDPRFEVVQPVVIRNFDDAPAAIEQSSGWSRDGRITELPSIVVRTHSRQTIVRVRVRWQGGFGQHAVSSFHLEIEPGESWMTSHPAPVIDWPTGPVGVQLLGVQFEDGSTWGSFDSTIRTADPWVDPVTGRRLR